MAAIEKYTRDAAPKILRHNDRTSPSKRDVHIDPDRANLNLRLHPDRGRSDASYYRALLSECYIYNRKNVVTLAEIIVTAPTKLPPERELDFFHDVYEELNRLTCGERCCVSARIHGDEEGEARHLHYDFVPIVRDDNPRHEQAQKVCVSDVLDLRFYHDLHPHLQATVGDKYHVSLHSGITKAQGGNRTIPELKRETPRSRWEDDEPISRGRWI